MFALFAKKVSRTILPLANWRARSLRFSIEVFLPEGIAKLPAPEKSMILSQFASVAERPELRRQGHTRESRTWRRSGKMAQKGGFAGAESFAISSLKRKNIIMRNPLHHRSIISIADLSKEEILLILKRAEEMKNKTPKEILKSKILASCFYEPSTRTRLSFESAMIRLGGHVIGFSDSNSTSAKKGESLQDAMRMIGQYADILIVRH